MEKKQTEQQLAGYCKECGDSLYVGDKAQIAYSHENGLEFTCEPCAISHGAVFPNDETVH